MERKRVVVTDHSFVDTFFEEAVAAEHGAEFAVFNCTTPEETTVAVNGADVAFVNFAPITKSVLQSMKSGSTIIRYGIGYDNVDVAAATRLNINVANVPDYGVETVADHAAACLLTLCRRLPEYDKLIHEQGWTRPSSVGKLRGFRSMTVGLVGMGRIALALHQRLKPFGFSFVAYDPLAPAQMFDSAGIESVSLLDLASRSHAISLHAPSNAQTRHMINAQFLNLVQPGTVLVNTARGPLVEEGALVAALRDGRLAGVALDVTDPEPLPSDSELRKLPGVILTPHAAFYDEDSLVRLQKLASEEAGRALRNEQLRCPVFPAD